MNAVVICPMAAHCDIKDILVRDQGIAIQVLLPVMGRNMSIFFSFAIVKGEKIKGIPDTGLEVRISGLSF